MLQVTLSLLARNELHHLSARSMFVAPFCRARAADAGRGEAFGAAAA